MPLHFPRISRHKDHTIQNTKAIEFYINGFAYICYENCQFVYKMCPGIDVNLVEMTE
jgi:hypothetical protein